MNMLLDHAVMKTATTPPVDLSGLPEAFHRAFGPTEPFPDDFGPIEMPGVTPLPYRGNRPINVRSRGSCRILAVFVDLETGQPRRYGLDSQLEYHHLALTLANPAVMQVREQVGPLPFVDDDGKAAKHFIDLVIQNRDGRRIAVAVKPTERLASGRFIRELECLRESIVSGIADELRLVTEHCISRVEAFNAIMYQRFALCPDCDVDARLAEILDSVHGEISICDLTRLCRAGGRGFRCIVRGLYEGMLTKVSPGRINFFTMVRAIR
ncbi:hypothetical protein [uncultured Roseobacter sp.]|uniref:hypothetical protein n=1 Tax=uncultured Roseobacter sp. TaxID=114847 RepID=UPI00262D8C66|nr:hypothetical protein [uncultured Roseobacter sp.]